MHRGLIRKRRALQSFQMDESHKKKRENYFVTEIQFTIQYAIFSNCCDSTTDLMLFA